MQELEKVSLRKQILSKDLKEARGEPSRLCRCLAGGGHSRQRKRQTPAPRAAPAGSLTGSTGRPVGCSRGHRGAGAAGASCAGL